MYEEDNIEYVDGRLRHTVVRDKENEPVNVLDVERDGNKYFLIGNRIKDSSPVKARLNEFNLKSPQLGYTNYDGKAFYVGRFPRRRDWRQGLRPDNLMLILPLDKIKRWQFDSIRPIYYAITKKYPSYREAIERVEDIYESCAFSPYFSVNSKHEITYKNQYVVGKHADELPKLNDEFEWLADLLRESL